jgi:tripeptidyl-peptidase-1
MEYSIPSSLTDYIDIIDPTTFLGKTVAAVSSDPQYLEFWAIPNSTKVPVSTPTKKDKTPTKRSIDAACSTSITPTCLKELYNTVGYTPSASSGSKVGFGSFLNQSAIYSDLFQYEEYFGIPHQNFSTVLIAGATNDQDIATAQYGEANLDVRIQRTFFSTKYFLTV